MHAGVQRLDAAVEHLGEAGDFAHVLHGEPGLPQRARRPSGGDQIPLERVEGAVARALDNSSVTPPDELARLVRIVGAAGIPFQVGTTNGGNDGSEFVRYGAVDVAIAWPLRYAHSPAEVIDLADLLALGRVVSALATTP